MNTEKCRRSYFIAGSKLCKGFAPEVPDGVQSIIYEVLKVIEAKPLFGQTHYRRLMKSVLLAGDGFLLDPEDFYLRLAHLIRVNNFQNGTIRINLYQLAKREILLYLFFVPPHYPDEQDYVRGVQVELLHAERPDPHLKKAITFGPWKNQSNDE